MLNRSLKSLYILKFRHISEKNLVPNLTGWHRQVLPFAAFQTSGTAAQSTNEAKLQDLLREKFPAATTIQVEDVSGGCGAMFEVWVESLDFKGLSRVKQHRLITQVSSPSLYLKELALKEEIKDMHGLRISTTVPENDSGS